MRLEPLNGGPILIGDELVHDMWAKDLWEEIKYVCIDIRSDGYYAFQQEGVIACYHPNVFTDYPGWLFLRRKEKKKTGFGAFIRRIEGEKSKRGLQNSLERVKKKQSERSWVKMKEIV